MYIKHDWRTIYMKRFITAAALIFALASAAFAGSISPASAEWNASTVGDLTFTITGAAGIISYEEAVKVGTTPLYFTFSGGKGDFGKEDYKFESPTLTIYADALKKMSNAAYSLTVTTTNKVTKTVTVADTDITVDLSSEDFAGVGAVVFEKEGAKTTFNPSEFSFASDVLTIAKGKVASGNYKATIYEGLPVTLTVSGNPEKQPEEEQQEEEKQEEEKQEEQKQEEKKSSDSGSGGGCNAGFGILALLCAAPMIFRKKQKRHLILR